VLQQGEWERMRLLATITVQPWSKKKITPSRLLPFPWEHEKKESKNIVSRDIGRERFNRLLEKLKDGEGND